jgi:hypothetical protein
VLGYYHNDSHIAHCSVMQNPLGLKWCSCSMHWLYDTPSHVYAQTMVRCSTSQIARPGDGDTATALPAAQSVDLLAIRAPTIGSCTTRLRAAMPSKSSTGRERYPAGDECPKGDVLCGVARAHACTAKRSITSLLDSPECCPNGWPDDCSFSCPKGCYIGCLEG